MSKSNSSTKSEKLTSDDNDIANLEMYYISKLQYIDDIIKMYDSDESYNILLCELYNGYKVVAILNQSEQNVLFLPVSLVQYEVSDNRVNYQFLSYDDLADDVSEIILRELPEVMYAPKAEVMTKYFQYWNSIRDKTEQKLKSLYDNSPIVEDNGPREFLIQASTKS